MFICIQIVLITEVPNSDKYSCKFNQIMLTKKRNYNKRYINIEDIYINIKPH